MEEKINFIEPLFERVEEYGKSSFELLKLKALDKTAGVLSTFLSRSTEVLFMIIFIVFTSIGAALWLGDLLGKVYYGFFCVAGFYGVIGAVLYFFLHGWIKKRYTNTIILHTLN